MGRTAGRIVPLVLGRNSRVCAIRYNALYTWKNACRDRPVVHSYRVHADDDDDERFFEPPLTSWRDSVIVIAWLNPVRQLFYSEAAVNESLFLVQYEYKE